MSKRYPIGRDTAALIGLAAWEGYQVQRAKTFSVYSPANELLGHRDTREQAWKLAVDDMFLKAQVEEGTNEDGNQ